MHNPNTTPRPPLPPHPPPHPPLRTLPHPPSFGGGGGSSSSSITVQSPIIGVTPSIQAPMPPPHHPLMTAHFQLPPHSSTPQPPPAMVLPGMPPYHAAQPASMGSSHHQALHPNPHSVLGNGQVTAHHGPPLAPPPELPLTNGQSAPQALPNGAANQEGLNGLQMLRTVGMGKYEFSDPGHPKVPLGDLCWCWLGRGSQRKTARTGSPSVRTVGSSVRCQRP
ncbi:unnamed protein product [Arctogadus glacialis]